LISLVQHIQNHPFQASGHPEGPLQNYIQKLAMTFPNTHLLVSGYQVLVQPIDLPKNTSIIESFDHFIDFLKH
jgi:hypothetical protein